MWWGGERREGGREGWRKGGGLKLWFGLCYVPDTVNLKVGAPLVCGILQSILLQKILYGNLWDFLSKLTRGFACKKTVVGYCWGKWNICTKPWYQMSSHRSNPLTVVIWPLSTPCIPNFHVSFKPVCSWLKMLINQWTNWVQAFPNKQQKKLKQPSYSSDWKRRFPSSKILFTL